VDLPLHHTDAYAPAASGVCALDHPFTLGSCEPLGATRLVSTPSRLAGLARDCRLFETVSPNLSGYISTVSDRAGKSTKGVLYH
jgi:hypothetical protein